MELETLFGLPAHPLLVHAPVVLVPLAALIAVVFAFRTGWMDRFGWGLVALAGAGALGAILAAGSGEALEERRKETEALEEHAEMGEIARTVSVLFFIIVLAVVLLRRYARGKGATGFWGFVTSKAGAIAIAAALVASAGGALTTIVIAGHQGAKVTWEDEGGEGGGDGEEEEHDDED